MALGRIIKALTLVLLMTSCSGNDVIPKLVPLEQFEVQEIVQDITTTDFLAPQVDIVIVIDGSGSMGTHINNVEANMDKFIDELVAAKLDFRIAITISGHTRMTEHRHLYSDLRATYNSGIFHTNDSSDQPPYFVTSSTPGVVDILKARVRVGTMNDAVETFFGPVLDAIEHSQNRPENLGFFREEAYLVPLFITDSDDQTYLTNHLGLRTGLIDVSDYYQKLVSFKGASDLVIPYGVIIPTAYGNRPPCSRGGEPEPYRIEDFIKMANGLTYDLCSASFGTQLADLATDLVTRVNGVFQLEVVPDPATIAVYYGHRKLPNDPKTGWVYVAETNSIVFGRDIHLDPDPNARLRVEFVPANSFRN